MFLTKVTFLTEKQQRYDINQALRYCNQLIDAWRYNGQIIGREIPVSYQFSDDDLLCFEIHVNCPEQTSLQPEYNSDFVQQAFANLNNIGVRLDHYEISAIDLNSDENLPDISAANELVLYTNYLKSSSPICALDTLAPIPLYHLCHQHAQLGMSCIKWEENWQACDQLQMNGDILEQAAVQQISEYNSLLFKQGYALRQQLEHYLRKPVYYYLYRIGGESYQQEQARCCPGCGRKWFLEQPINIFNFKCDHCRLVSNIAWELQ